MMLQKLPVTVLNRMWSRSMSRLCSNQINVSKAEVKAFRQILARSGIQANARFLQNLSGFQGSQVSQVISRNFSTTPKFRQNDGRNNKDDDDGKLISRKKLPLASVKRFHECFYDFFTDFERERKMSMLKTITIIGWMAFLVFILTPNPNAVGQGLNKANSIDNPNPQNMNNQRRGDVSWNDFYHNMLQAGEVQEVRIFPKIEMAEVRLKPGAFYKVSTTIQCGKYSVEIFGFF